MRIIISLHNAISDKEHYKYRQYNFNKKVIYAPNYV